MKVLLLVFFMHAHTLCITAGFSYDAWEVPNLEAAIKKKCITDDNLAKLNYAFAKFQQCISGELQQDYLDESLNPFVNNSNYCNSFKKDKYLMCIKHLTINMSPCLAKNEIYLQKFLLDAFEVAYEESCGMNGVSNAQYLYDKINRTRKCLQMCQGSVCNFGTCDMENLNIFKHLGKGVLDLSKHAVCRDLESLQKCTTQVLKGTCNEEYSRFTSLLFHPFLKACNDLDAKK